MSLIAFGTSHQNANIDIREKFNFSPDEIPCAMQTIQKEKLAQEVVIFSTCNRTELYLAGTKDPNMIYNWVCDYHKISPSILKDYTYLYQDKMASKHLFRVATGLDSLSIGEPQILGQIKAAYQVSVKNKTVKQTLNRLFQEAFYIAKNVRTTTKLGENSISIAYAAVKMTDQFYSDHKPLTAMIIGAGETSELAAKTLHKKGVNNFIFVNRTLSKAQHLALSLGGYAVTLEQCGDHLHNADIIVSATSKDENIISYDMTQKAQLMRKHKMQVFLDLAVPRDINDSIRSIEGVYLYAVDDLETIINKNKELRLQAAEQAEELVEQYNDHFIDWLSLRQHHNLIRDIHQYNQDQKKDLLAQALKQLEKGQNPEEVLQSLATRLTKKLTHQPSLLVRRANETGNSDMLDEIKSIYRLD